MKGVIIAGGRGTRLYPLTAAVSKQLLPLHDKPLIYYPLSALMLAGLRDILVVTAPRDVGRFRELLGDGSQWGVSLSFQAQPEPAGIAHAFAQADGFLAGEPAAVILGDNVLHGRGLRGALRSAIARQLQHGGATIFLHPVDRPQLYGIAEIDEGGRVVTLEEKPSVARSNLAAIGLYLYDGDAVAMAPSLHPSPRGELEITELNRLYLEAGSLRAHRLGRGVRWLDPGAPRELAEAGRAVASAERRTGRMIGSPEAVAISEGWISADQLERHLDTLPESSYTLRLLELASRARRGSQ